MDVVDDHRTVPRLPAPAVAIGNFDGVHLGHRALLDRAIAAARAAGGTAVALTFDPHPSAVIAPHLAPALITPRRRKLELLAAAGVDTCVVEPFTPELAALTAPEFVDRVLIGALGARHVVVGFDFGYGHGRGGNADTLRAHGARAGFTVEVVDQVVVDGEVASSTRIRGHLRAGALDAARRLLGRRYDVGGAVVRGAGRGRGLGIPTANVEPHGDILAGPGIYAVRLRVAGGRLLDAVASLGTNPTFVERGRLVLEVHVLDWDGDLYGQDVRVDFVARLRDEVRFDGADALVAQIHRDIADARAALAADPPA